MVFKFLLSLPIIALFEYVFYESIRLVYRRWFRSYNGEIVAWLQAKGLHLIEIGYPNAADWQASPFEKPPLVSFNFSFISVFGFTTSWTKKEYQIIQAVSSKDKVRLFWLEIETSFFCKPALRFKEAKMRKEKAMAYKNVVTNFNACPACNYPLNKQDIICPDCGLHFA
jgi:hypothetical protein